MQVTSHDLSLLALSSPPPTSLKPMSYGPPPPSYNNVHAPTQGSLSSNLSLEPLSLSDGSTQFGPPPSANFPQRAIGAGLTRSNSRPLPAVPPTSPRPYPAMAPIYDDSELPSSDPFPPPGPIPTFGVPQAPPPQSSQPPPSGSGSTPSPPVRRPVPMDEPFDSPGPTRFEVRRTLPPTSEVPRNGGYGGPSGVQPAKFDDNDDSLPGEYSSMILQILTLRYVLYPEWAGKISHLETAQESLHVPNKELPRYRRRIFHLPETNPPITTTIPTGQRDLTPLTCLEKVFHSVGHRLLHHQLKSNGTTPYIITPHHPTCLRQRPGCFTLLQHHNDKTTTINLVTGVVAMRAPLANRSTISTMH